MSDKQTSKRPAKRRPDLDTVYSINQDGSRNYLHPADVKGRWQTRKNIIFAVLAALYLVMPWITIAGNPMIRFDLPGRAAYLFGATFTNQDFYLAYFIISGIGFALFVLTSLWGRVWCGYFCPQTVFLEGFFRRIERWIEGPRNRRIRRNLGPMTFDKFWRKTLKQGIYLLLATVIAHAFLAYFIPVRELLAIVPDGPQAHMSAFLWTIFWTAVLYFDFAWFREQTCLIICPYGRLQSTLIDKSTIIIGYDQKRGEPRDRAKNVGGDCIDCFRCVEVCPTGIDIRNGLQLECVGCANCIDACNDVMRKMGKAEGLVRYDSELGFESGQRKFFRPRVVLYLVLGLVGMTVFSASILRRAPFQANMLRSSSVPFVIEEDSIRNIYNLSIQNKTVEAKTYVITPASPKPGAPSPEFIIPQPELHLGGLQDTQVPIFAVIPRKEYHSAFQIVFQVSEPSSGYTRDVEVRFRGP